MPFGDGAFTVATKSRVALIHIEVPQEPSGQGYESRVAHGAFLALRREGVSS